MDALPVTEDTDLPFKSTARSTYLGQDVGVMHACGHDIHVAVQLGVASILTAIKDQVPGTIQFIFQPAEEGAPPGEQGGAELMLKEGIWKDAKPKAVFGLHVNAQTEVGQVWYNPGPTMAAADMFRILIKGTPAHGARPELSVDPVVVASQAVLALQTIRSRNVSPFAPFVLTIGTIRGGQRNNIIPEEVELRGTVRTFDAKVQDLVERRMREVLDGVHRPSPGRDDARHGGTGPQRLAGRSPARSIGMGRIAGTCRMDQVLITQKARHNGRCSKNQRLRRL
jgi:amidohydrolase